MTTAQRAGCCSLMSTPALLTPEGYVEPLWKGLGWGSACACCVRSARRRLTIICPPQLLLSHPFSSAKRLGKTTQLMALVAISLGGGGQDRRHALHLVRLQSGEGMAWHNKCLSVHRRAPPPNNDSNCTRRKDRSALPSALSRSPRERPLLSGLP